MSDEPFRRLSPLTPVVRGFIVVVAAATTSWDDVLRGELGPAAVLFLGLLIAGAAYGFFSWYLTKFWIGSDELRVDTGVLNRQSRRIRIDRLQGVDITQPFVARLFGLAELKMDVAGGGEREGSLAFLPLAEARELKDVLLARRDAAREGDGIEAGHGEPADAASRAADRTLARVPLKMLALSVLLSPEAVSAVVVSVAFVFLALLVDEVGGISVVLPIVGGLALVLFRRFAGNYRFTVSEGPAGMQVRRGLFDLSTQTIALARVQGVVIREPLLWRRLGWAKVDVSIAGYGSPDDGDGPSASTVLPVGELSTAVALARHVLSGLDPAGTPLSAPPAQARWVAPIGRRYMGAGKDASVIVSREGLTRRTHVVPHARIQSLRIKQGPWQRRLGLADLLVDSPPGPANVRLRHRSTAEVRWLLEDEVLIARGARREPEPRRPGLSPR